MSEYLNEDICQFSNDASASSFGWNFQANAGIFLFLKYMPDAADIKIESISQDIEITLIDERKVFAQAKSAQDSTTIKDQKEKFKDAIISLARNPYKDNQLVYISNIPDTFKSAPNFFNNSIIPYNDCLAGIQKEIDDTILSISKNIAKKIKKEKDPLKIRKLEQIKVKVENFHKENLYISTIYPYYGNEKNRYTIIGDSVLSFLTDTIGLTRDVDDKMVAKEDFIFTSDLKSLSGAVLQKMVFAFKVAFLKVIEESMDTKLFIVLDSPKGKELDDDNMKLIENLVSTELCDNQIFFASIYDLEHEKLIEIKNRAIEGRNN